MIKRVVILGVSLFLGIGQCLSAQQLTIELLPDVLGDFSDIDFSDNGQFVVYFDRDIGRINVDTGEVEVLNPALVPRFNDETGTINYDGSRIAYAGNWQGNRGIYVYDFNTATVHTIAEMADQILGVPSISGDGNRVIFYGTADFGSNPDHSGEMFLGDINGQITQLTEGIPGPQVITHHPSGINFDGTILCFNNDFGGFNSFYIWREGSGLQIIDSLHADDPSMSQDGSTVVFNSYQNHTGENPNGFYQTFIMDTSTLEFTQISHKTGFDFESIPSISADGQWILFFSNLNLTGSHPGFHDYLANRNGEILGAVPGDGFPYPVVSHNGRSFVNRWNDRLQLVTIASEVPVLSDIGLIIFVVLMLAVSIRVKRMP